LRYTGRVAVGVPILPSAEGRAGVLGLQVSTLLAVIVVLHAAPVSAQELPRLEADAAIVLRPTPDSRALAQRMVRTLAIRLPVGITVGEDAPPQVLEAVPSGHCAVARDDDAVRLVLGGPEAQVFRTEVVIEGLRGAAVARAVALALEALRETALDGPPPGESSRRTLIRRDGREVTWLYREREGGLFGPQPVVEATAKPLVMIGFMGGVSTERITPQLAPRIGFGLCQTAWCLMLEGDLPVVPETTEACDGRQVEYRPITLGLRLLLRPFVIDDVSIAFGLGILTRFGVANLVGVEASRLTTNFGLRGTAEVAWRVADPFEIVFDVGLDAHTSPAILTRLPRPPPGMVAFPGCPPGAERVLVEDIITVWGVLAVRLRPGD